MIELNGKKRILIVRLGKIGDIIIASSVFFEWKKLFPENHITLVTLYKNKNVLKYNKDLDEIYYVKNRAQLFFQLIKLRSEKFDLLVDLNDDPSTTSALIRKYIKARVTAGFKFYKKHIPDLSIDQPQKIETHIIDRVKALLKNLNSEFDNSDLKPIFYVGETESRIVHEAIKKYRGNKKIISINISAGAPIRYWPEKKWIELINRICKDSTNWLFIILSEKRDERLKELILQQIDNNRIIPANFYSFQHYVAYIKNSDVLITPDTAAVHIASAFDIPVIAIYPNYEWNFISWQPLSTHFRAIKAKEENISNVNVDEVYQSFISLTSEF
jgi:ADP-heptose:LPS heptosyltransferase